ncbi:3-oxoacyl-ACP synthase III family protein [Nonomuraea gerenzanensis]|uniref:3-oxoacyl-ACP synthase III family protein n=1 Tax=Nonomuraea gerenzanensis TaxID=93944 RepID=UPI001CDA0513|nr:3-oxoacyl-ACP synthase III family protein [Nonomuraea gerenzanensis]UBU08684.1 3-oxoacyl-ACP synthase III family protein [Nonomuraea gerenzanensis]
MSRSRYSRVAGAAVHLPDGGLTTPQLEDLLAERNPGISVPRGLIERHSGVRFRHVAPPGWMASDLAVAAARELLRQTGHTPPSIDLIIYAGVSGDAVEPATGHMVAAKLGADCPVFDVRDACNSVLRAIHLADALITGGHHRTVLVACGEVVTSSIQWRLESQADFEPAIPSYTVSDSGTALLLESSGTPGVLGGRFGANSAYYEASIMPFVHDGAGGLRAGRFTIDPVALAIGVQKLDLGVLRQPLAERGLGWEDVAVVCVHQPSLAALHWLCELIELPRDKAEVTIAEHGNLAAATLPMQLHLAERAGRLARGDLVALVGVASGLSSGTVLLRW